MGTTRMTPTENSITPYNILGVLKRCYLVASCMVRSETPEKVLDGSGCIDGTSGLF